ncbi:MAG: TPM domain-containing protein [Gemmatimonadaceae bacterium]|nr:TPM domain-containing protein [Gemmatimonadaceae bacterium]
MLDAATIGRMNRIAEDVRAKSRGEMAIVTLSTIGERQVEDIALRIGREWKVGKIGNPGDPTRNAGAVILLVPKETSTDGRGHCFIATGQGAEGFITDATAGDICREATPAFRAREYSTGLELVTLRTAERFAREFNFSLDSSLAPPVVLEREPRRSRGIPPFVFLILFFIILSVLSNASRGGNRKRRGRRDGCGGGMPIIIVPTGRGGGGWGGGGGGFGGGGGGFGGFGGGGGFSGGGGGSSW